MEFHQLFLTSLSSAWLDLVINNLSAFFQMEQKRSWYIPRPSLSSNSSSNTNKSHDSIRCYHRDSEVIDIEPTKEKKGSTKNAAASSASSSISSQRSKNQIQMETSIDGECETPKRGSRSSQGSSDSEQSIHVGLVQDNLTIAKSKFSLSLERIISPPNGSEFRELCQNSGTITSSSRIAVPRQHRQNPQQSLHYQHSSQ